jgi:hypothetical protein
VANLGNGLAILALRHTSVLGPAFKCDSRFFGTHESPTDVSVFRAGIECNELIAALAVRLEPVADLLRTLSKYLRALRAFDFHFFVDHEISLSCGAGQPAFHSLRACFGIC